MLGRYSLRLEAPRLLKSRAPAPLLTSPNALPRESLDGILSGDERIVSVGRLSGELGVVARGFWIGRSDWESLHPRASWDWRFAVEGGAPAARSRLGSGCHGWGPGCGGPGGWGGPGGGFDGLTYVLLTFTEPPPQLQLLHIIEPTAMPIPNVMSDIIACSD